MTYKYRVEVCGLHTVQTVKWVLEESDKPRAKAFSLLAYSRLDDDARNYLNDFVKNGYSSPRDLLT